VLDIHKLPSLPFPLLIKALNCLKLQFQGMPG
jgi:hypothetical protein